MRLASLQRPFAPAILFLSMVSTAALVSSQAATVSGTITVGSTKVVPKSASAVGYTAPNGRLVSVLVSDKPADRKEFLELTKVGANEPLVAGIIEGAWKSLHFDQKLSGFLFTIDADRKILSNEFLVGGKDDAFSIPADDLLLELTSTAPRLAGRIRTKEPILSLGSQQVGLDVTFDVAVGEPGK
jgi:hypothetical protein